MNDLLPTPLKVVWMGPSLKHLRAFPESVRRDVGYLLGAVQRGGSPSKDVKPWKGAYPRTFEIALAARGDAYRVVFTTRKTGLLHVLHAFKKKSHRDVETPQEHIDAIEHRQKAIDRY